MYFKWLAKLSYTLYNVYDVYSSRLNESDVYLYVYYVLSFDVALKNSCAPPSIAYQSTINERLIIIIEYLM